MTARHTLPALALCIGLTSGCGTEPTMTAATPQTRAEKTTYQETSRYDDVRAFIAAMAQQTGRVRVEMFGKSEEGRDLPLLVVGDPPVPGPAGRSSRVPVVLVMANIHAGEVEGKEATLHLVRRLTLGDLQPLLRSAVWLFAPIYNADGNEKISLDNRVEQNGPIGGVGTRENAKGLDLNRDFMKLESSEARGLVSVFTRWDPDVIVDLHTTNGSYHGYHLTYGPPFNPNTDSHIAAFTRDQLLTTVREAMNARHGFRTFDYGNFATTDAMNDELEGFEAGDTRQKVWRTFDARPRFGTNYGGIRNRIAILSEAYSYLDFERRVKATEAFTEEIMRFVAAHGDAIRSLTSRADDAWVAGEHAREQGVASALQALPKPVAVLVGAIGSKVNPRSGNSMRTMVESTAIPTSMLVYDRFVSTAMRRVPAEYIVAVSPNGLHDVVERKLREHGIQVEKLGIASRRAVEELRLTQVRHADQAFQGHHTTSIEGRFEKREIDLPAGSLIVRTSQRLGGLVFYLLEPESDDGLTTWNFLDSSLKVGAAHPIVKSAP
jgi:Zinc carboxypeptidase